MSGLWDVWVVLCGDCVVCQLCDVCGLCGVCSVWVIWCVVCLVCWLCGVWCLGCVVCGLFDVWVVLCAGYWLCGLWSVLCESCVMCGFCVSRIVWWFGGVLVLWCLGITFIADVLCVWQLFIEINDFGFDFIRSGEQSKTRTNQPLNLKTIQRVLNEGNHHWTLI